MSASYDLNEAMELAVRKARPEDDEVQVWAGRLMQKFTAEKLFHYRGFLSIRLDEVMAASLSAPFALGGGGAFIGIDEGARGGAVPCGSGIRPGQICVLIEDDRHTFSCQIRDGGSLARGMLKLRH